MRNWRSGAKQRETTTSMFERRLHGIGLKEDAEVPH
jgi:hypothetical protein